MVRETKENMNTPYDDAFKSIIRKCPRLALALINELFYCRGFSDEMYTGQEQLSTVQSGESLI